MTPFCFEHEFRGDPQRYWELFFDEESTRAQFAATGVSNYTITELTRGEDTWRRVIEATPDRDLPVIIRKVTGATLSFTESTVFDVANQIATTTVVPKTMGSRIDLTGQHTLEIHEPNRFTRRFKGHVDVRVALVGKRIEKMVLADMEKSYKVGTALTQANLDK